MMSIVVCGAAAAVAVATVAARRRRIHRRRRFVSLPPCGSCLVVSLSSKSSRAFLLGAWLVAWPLDGVVAPPRLSRIFIQVPWDFCIARPTGRVGQNSLLVIGQDI